jgi:ATP-dependent protease ClpP protease subunit
MIEVNVYKVIDSEDVFFSWMFGEDLSFSADTVHRVFDENPDEKEFQFNINCDGGSVAEGLRIYDVLRTSGKTLYCNIEGGCHSMAVVLLLAAPAENRTANPNARALIHEVRVLPFDDMTATQLRSLADEIDTEQDAILDIYAERTGHDRAELETLMKEEKQRTAQELLNYGFISKINAYTTNKNKKRMDKKPKNVKGFLARLKNLLENEEPVNYDFTDADGNVLFSTEKEDDSLAVGDPVTIPDGSTDGTFTLEDGRTVTVAEGKVSEITEAGSSNENDEHVAALENALEEAGDIIEAQEEELVNLRNQVKNNTRSNYRVPSRQNNGKNTKPGQKTAEQLKEEMVEKRNQAKSKGGKA